jgi:hypothetical protein
MLRTIVASHFPPRIARKASAVALSARLGGSASSQA